MPSSKEVKVTEKIAVTEPKELTIDAAKHYEATLATSKGDIHLSLNAEKAPWSVNNFVYLAKAGFYEGLTFHRVVPGFVIQGGDPAGNGTGGPGYTVKGETTNGLLHEEGALAWARTGDQINPERRSSGSQFYITLAPTPALDNQYTVFGKTISGMEVVKKIQVGDVINKVTVTEK
ncbi:MAG: peptidylprolyl isomerase [Deltaproteobacteria bacterium]|nr:peptidylprolyl isomerase [Deltaproteobacteria bacterium]